MLLTTIVWGNLFFPLDFEPKRLPAVFGRIVTGLLMAVPLPLSSTTCRLTRLLFRPLLCGRLVVIVWLSSWALTV